MPLSLPFDILSAGDSVAELTSLISAFLKAACLLDELSQFWASAKHQRRLLQRRVEELARITDGSRPESLMANGQYWTACEPIESYAPGNLTLFMALRARYTLRCC